MKIDKINIRLVFLLFIIFISIFLSLYVKYNSKDIKPPKKSVLVKLTRR